MKGTELWMWHDEVLAMRDYITPQHKQNYAYTTGWAFVSPISGEVFARHFIQGPLPVKWIPWTAYDMDELPQAPPMYRKGSLFSNRGDFKIPKAVIAHHFERLCVINLEEYEWDTTHYKLRA